MRLPAAPESLPQGSAPRNGAASARAHCGSGGDSAASVGGTYLMPPLPSARATPSLTRAAQTRRRRRICAGACPSAPSKPIFWAKSAAFGPMEAPAPQLCPKTGLRRRYRPPATRPECPATRETRGHLPHGGLPARRGLMTAPGTVPTARTRSGLGSGLRPSAAWSPNPLGTINSPPIKIASRAPPPFRLTAREIPDLATGKTAAHYGATEAAAPECAARLRRAPFFPVPRSVARYGSHGAPRASLPSPRRTARKPPKTARNPSFPHCGKCFSIAWKIRKKFFHSVEKSAKYFL